MADNTFIIRTYDEAPAKPGASKAVRGEQLDFSASDPDDDISTIRHGSDAILGKAVWSANNALRRTDTDEAERKKETASGRERDLIRMAEWDAARITVGGVEMTNAEAQEARRRILDQREKYIRQAINRGDITEGQGKTLMDGIQRDYDLAEKERRGTITAAERAEREQWQHSHLGAVAENLIAGSVTEQRAEMNGPAAKSNALFPSAPQVNSAFVRAHDNIAASEPPAPSAPPPELQKSGLDF